MRPYVVLRYVGMVLLLNAFFMLISAIVSFVNGMDTGFFPLLLSFVLTAVMGVFPLIFVSSDTTLLNKESYVIVVSAWVMSCIVGMLPYILWGGEFNFVNACFESVSGFTTTGGTVLQDVEALPKGLLFWRSCTHLIGGAGIILFALALMPAMSRTKMSLTNLEISSLAKDNYRYRIQKTMRVVLVVYVFLITTETMFLKIAGMNWFDAVNHSFSTVSTGGFSTKNLSIAYYNNVWIEIIITVFMVLSGFHFGLLFTSITSKRNNIFRSEVARYYFFSIVVASLLLTVNLWATDTYSLVSAVRYAFFQLAAVTSTTGFATVDTASWPAFSILILIFFSLQCACAGSTSGGIKSDRVLMLFKIFRTRILQMQHPNAIVRVKMDNVPVNDDVVRSVSVFITLYLFVLFVGALMLTGMGIDLMTSFSAMVACLGNVGPGFGEVSSLGNFSDLPVAGKLICAFAMLLGRLELFGFLQIFLIKSWR